MSARHKTRNVRYRQWVRWQWRVIHARTQQPVLVQRGWLRFGGWKDRVKDREYLMRRGRPGQ